MLINRNFFNFKSYEIRLVKLESGDKVKRYILSLSIFLLIVCILIGCSSQEIVDNSNLTDDKQIDSMINNVDNNTVGEDIIDNGETEVNRNVTFDDFFSKEKIADPQNLLNSIIPDFKIGMTVEHVKANLGEPDEIILKESLRGQENHWVYQNAKNYQLTIMFLDNRVVNFELNKYLSSQGVVPKIVNKTLPKQGGSLEYFELGFEGVLLGSTVEEVLNFYGEPIRCYLSNDDMYGYELVMIYKGLLIQIFLEQDQPSVQYFKTNDLDKVSTYRNISVGSSLDEVILEYGQPEYDGWQESDFLIYSTDNYWSAIRFEFSDNNVSSISIYNAS